MKYRFITIPPKLPNTYRLVMFSLYVRDTGPTYPSVKKKNIWDFR